MPKERNVDGYAPIPVILMSAAGRDVADGSGADDYLDKPFYLDEVEALVYEWFSPGTDSD